MKICIGVRVYNRIMDLEVLIDIINKTWRKHDYDIVVITNGEYAGYTIPHFVRNNVNHIVSISQNSGHILGSSQLLLALYDYTFNMDYAYHIIIEADTWMHGDDIVDKYIGIMENDNEIVYAGAHWYDNYYSLASDFGIIKSSYLYSNRNMFLFKNHAECHIANYINSNNGKFLYITENTYPNLPGYAVRFMYPFSSKGRINCFPFSKTVTHHIEDLKGGIERKKRLFDIVSQTNFFGTTMNANAYILRCLMIITFLISKILFRKSWYSRNNTMLDC